MTSNTDEDFSKQIVQTICNCLNKNNFDILITDLGELTYAQIIIGNDKSGIKNEFEKLRSSDYIYVVFPFCITGVPSMINAWFDKVLAFMTTPFNKKKALTITSTDFSQESFQPNSLHQSTVKRRLHHFNWLTLKHIGIDPLEPLVYYTPVIKQQISHLSHKSTLESFKFNSKKSAIEKLRENNISAIGNDSNNNINKVDTICENDKESKSFGDKLERFSLVNKKNHRQEQQEQKARDDFLLEVSRAVKNIELYLKLDLTDL